MPSQRVPILCASMQPMDDLDAFLRLNGGCANIYAGIKLDGVRNRAATTEERTWHLSRSGCPFPNFGGFDADCQALQREIARLTGLAGIVLDGEACDESGRFQDILGDLRSLRDAEPSGFRYHLYDWYAEDAAESLAYEDRRSVLMVAGANVLRAGGIVRVHRDELRNFRSKAEIQRLFSQAVAAGAEGLVLKTAFGLYEHGESRHWCRLVAVRTIDLLVLEMFEGKTELAGHAVRFVCHLPNGGTVGVGPGATPRAELRRIWERYAHEGVMPAIIEVAYKERTTSGSLREPRLRRVRDDKA